MQNKKYILILLGFFLFFIGVNHSLAYYDKYAKYKKLGKNILKVEYIEYHNYKDNEKYKKSDEYKELSKLTKVDNIFDIASKEAEKKMLLKKNNILSKLRNEEKVIVGTKQIDDEIDLLEKKGRYLVLKLPGDLIALSDNHFIYIYKHKVVGNVDLVTKMKLIFKDFRENKDKTKFKNNIIKLLDKYNIKYKEIKGYGIPAEIYIGKNFNKKMKQKTLFFISKGFTTPELADYFEKESKGKTPLYIWKYLPDDDIKYDYNIREGQRNGSVIIVKNALLNDGTYMGMVSDNDKILVSSLLQGKLDMYIYNINKNNYEYIILLIIFLLGLALGVYFLFNFLQNYKNNFKKIPEEL